MLLDAQMEYQLYVIKTAITFHNQTARAACRPKEVCCHAGVTPRIRLGDVDNPEAPIVQNSDSGKTADAKVIYFLS